MNEYVDGEWIDHDVEPARDPQSERADESQPDKETAE